MGNLTIMVQTVNSAAWMLIIFILVAAFIGYMTSYYYYSSIYTKKIHVLEIDNSDLNTEVGNLKMNLIDLQKNLNLKEEEILELKNKMTEDQNRP